MLCNLCRERRDSYTSSENSVELIEIICPYIKIICCIVLLIILLIFIVHYLIEL